MAQVKKLMINGVRSFDPNNSNKQMIEFYSPMTLIVGQNGCGKTTIIEALKFAITNEYPPGSSKGQTFVNDPKLSAGYEVGAVVKLELEEKNGAKVIITRRMKATQKGKAGAVSVAMIEATIRRMINGEKIDISSKCVDMKNEMCRMMGVSDAILNNVIFCHQEDSCWPLTEGKKVKEKFDAIFNTTMYMKALDEFAKKDKELLNIIKVAEVRLEMSTGQMRELKQKNRAINAATIQLAESTDMTNKQEKELEEMAVKLRQFQSLEDEYVQISSAVESARGKINFIKDVIADLKSKSKPLAQTLPQLQAEMQDFKVTGNQHQQKLSLHQIELTKRSSELSNMTEQKNKFLKEEGVFQQQERDNDKRLASLKQMMATTIGVVQRMKDNSQDDSFSSSVEPVLESFNDDSSSVSPTTLVRALNTAIRSKDSEHRKCQVEFASREAELQLKLDKSIKSKSEHETEIKLKNSSIVENRGTMDDLKKRLASIEGSTEALALLDDDEERWTETIDNIQNSGFIARCEKEVQGFTEEIKKLEKRRAALGQEIKILTQDKIISDQIATHNRHKISKKTDSLEIKRRIQDQVRNVLDSFPEENLSKHLETKINTLTKEVSQKEKEFNKKQTELSKYEAEEKQIVRELQTKENSLRDWKEQLDEVLEGSLYETKCSDTADELDKATKDSYYNEAAQYLYKKYIQKMKKKSGCPLCKRDFDQRSQTQALIEELEGAVQNLLVSGPADKANVEKLKTRHEDLLKLKPRWEDIKALETKQIPDLRRRKSLVEEKCQTTREEFEALTDSVHILKTDLTQCRSLVRDAANYDQNMEEVKKIEGSIQTCERDRNPAAQDCTLTLPDAEDELQSVEGSISAKRLEKDSKEAMRNSKRDELTAAQQKRNAVKEDKLRITSEMQNREALETQKKSLEDSTKELQAAISAVTKKIPQLNNEIATGEKKRAELSAEKDSTLSKISTERGELEANKNKLNELNALIEDFETVTKVKGLEKQKQFAQCKKKLEEGEALRGDLLRKIDSLKEEIGSHEIKKRNLEDNISIKTREIEIATLTKELGPKEAALAASANRGVATEKKDLSTKFHNMSTLMNQNKGKQNEIRKNLNELRKEISCAPYTNLEAEHCKNLVTRAVHVKAKRDILLYKTALDSAIMKFHHKKMETINKYLKYFWKKIYRGNDIDYIQIRTENEDVKGEGPSTVKIAAKKKVYNYRVVMIRMGVELDMRGRCSAGQKVLASIIIRMALAQTFSAKCGIITLDEPTTNLDKRNIESLATTLSQLAAEMKNVKTFQLIIITHDQDFIDKLLLGDPADYYFKVSRDRQGYSQIDRICRE